MTIGAHSFDWEMTLMRLLYYIDHAGHTKIQFQSDSTDRLESKPGLTVVNEVHLLLEGASSPVSARSSEAIS
jgi:hypothetical protein